MPVRSIYKKRSRQKDYQAKGLKNPFFRVKKKTQPRTHRWRLIVALIILFLLVWFFWFSPVFAISRTQVKGLARIAPGNIETLAWQQSESRRWLVFKQNNIFTFDNRALAKRIASAYNFASLDISKKWWKKEISIQVKERAYAFIWQEGNNYFYSDAEGNLIRDEAVTPDSQKQYFTLENRGSASLIINDKSLNLNKDYLPFIFVLNGALKNNSDFKINKYFVDNELNTIKLALDGGPEIYFSTREGAPEQLDKLVVVKRETIKDGFNKIKYIDLRYKDKVYYQ